ncbi:MAG: prepilin-type N-terminal cleavage/methylation domain-containing protein [Elusimicrobia bacterium]|nr:prepilin-type N-terminal cleavage/methylation domain-containing protein [Elusimicrobiota bacterium]
MKIKGFTLIEMIIVVTLVVILSSISVPFYKDYTKKAKYNEAYVLLSVIRDAQMRYYSEYKTFISRGNINEPTADVWGYGCASRLFGIDARTNKYFTRFAVGAEGTGSTRFIAVAQCSNLPALTLIYDLTNGVTYR